MEVAVNYETYKEVSSMRSARAGWEHMPCSPISLRADNGAVKQSARSNSKNLVLHKRIWFFFNSKTHPNKDALLFHTELFISPVGVILNGNIRHPHHP